MKEETAEIVASLVWALVCLVIGIFVWARLTEGIAGLLASLSKYGVMSVTLPIPSNPYVRALILLGIINGSHFLLGLFHMSDDPRQLSAAQRGHCMHTPGDFLGIVIWIVAVVTIGPSRYLRDAIICYRGMRKSV